MAITAETVLMNLNANLEPVMPLIVGGAYILGMVMVTKGIFKFRKLAELNNQMASGADLSAAIVYILIGALFIWLPGFFEASSVTVFGDANLMSYDAIESGYGIWEKTLYHIMQIIGAIAFVRGWMIIASSTESNSQQGTFTKGLTHVIGGVLCYHIIPFFEILNATLGSPFSISF